MSLPSLAGLEVALDTEGTGLEWWKPEIVAFGCGVAYRVGGQLEIDPKTKRALLPRPGEIRAFYVDLREDDNMEWLREELPQVKLWINHAIKYDVHMLREMGVKVNERRLSCTMIREALIEENKYEFGLDPVSYKYLGYGKNDPWAELAKMFGGAPTREAQILNLQYAPKQLVANYAIPDAVNALLVHEMQAKIIKDEELEFLYWNVEIPLLRTVIYMERYGVCTNQSQALTAHRQLHGRIRNHQKELNKIAGFEVNANSPDQTKRIVGVHLREDGRYYTADGLRTEMTEPSRTHPKGQPSVPMLLLQQCAHPAAEHIVQIRSLAKARDVMLGTYVLQMHHEGYIHASINQTRNEDGNGVYTGRFSITDPALQQIHKRNKALAAIVRAVFVPDPWADFWWCIDWAQVDFRVFAHFLNDLRINGMYAADPNTDFHTLAAEITGLPRDRDEKTGGANAKQINLANVFGMGAGELARQCRLPYTINARGYLEAGPEAKRLFARYHDNIRGVRKLQSSVESVAKRRGHIRTMLGRRLRFPGGYGAHKAAGLLYQATAADMMKVKLIEVHEYIETLPPESVRLALTVHDEFDGNCTREARERGWIDEIKGIVERFEGERWPIKLRIPIRGDLGYGENWWIASK